MAMTKQGIKVSSVRPNPNCGPQPTTADNVPPAPQATPLPQQFAAKPGIRPNQEGVTAPLDRPCPFLGTTDANGGNK